jgi:hypothetical protein
MDVPMRHASLSAGAVDIDNGRRSRHRGRRDRGRGGRIGAAEPAFLDADFQRLHAAATGAALGPDSGQD